MEIQEVSPTIKQISEIIDKTRNALTSSLEIYHSDYE